MVCDLRESLVDLGRNLSGYERFALNFLYHFRVKTCFFRSFTHNAHAKQLTFHHAPWKQRPKSNHNTPNHCTIWRWTWRQFFKCFNCIQLIKFHFATLDYAPSRVISLLTTCILPRILTALYNSAEKNWHGTNFMLLIVQFSRILTFSTNKFAYNYFGLYPIACSFLLNNLHFMKYFTNRGKSLDRRQPIKEPSLEIYPFLRKKISSLWFRVPYRRIAHLKKKNPPDHRLSFLYCLFSMKLLR